MSDVHRPAAWLSDPTGRHQYRYWNGTEWTDQVADNQVTSTDPPLMGEGTAPPSASAPKPKAGRIFSWLALAGAGVLAIGSVLTAFSFSSPIDQTYSFISGGRDGQLLLPLAVIVGILAVLCALGKLPRWGVWLVFVGGMIGFFVGIADYSDVKDKIDTLERVGGSGSVGPAMVVCVIGGAITMVFAVLAFFKPEAPPTDPAG